ncbi:unnamed protein product [Symbiodinium natans]|uniref:Uncharacterized protein n=1 Tax=Symbiodinium natans TaxID=878477 RepID=A0A812LN19_9DINO|nr:unnamed protein product [Symbiodinium natans]
MSDDELDPGLRGYSDSGSDYHDLPEPPLPEEVRKTIREAAPTGVLTLKRPTEGDMVKVRCVGPLAPALAELEDEQGHISLDLGSGRFPRLEAAVSTMRLGEVAKFHFGQSVEGDGLPTSLELTLADWTPRVDLFQDGRAVKSLLHRGDDRRRPIIGQVCLVRCALHSEEGGAQLWTRDELEHVIEDMPPLESSHRFEFGIKEGWKLMDKALLSMRRGERCQVRVDAALLCQGAPKGLLPTALEGPSQLPLNPEP